MDNVWSSLSARLKRDEEEDESSFDDEEESWDGLFVDMGVGTGLEKDPDNRFSVEGWDEPVKWN